MKPRLMAGIGAAALLGVCTVGCSSSGARSDAAPTSTTPVASGPRHPAPSISEAVTQLLQAEQGGDHAASFALISDGGRALYKDAQDWTRRRSQLPAVTGFKIDGAGNAANTVVATVDHQPSLNAFIGLSPAEEHQTWTGRKVTGGWLVDPEPDIAMVLPPDGAVPADALAWAKSVQSCDGPAARSQQAVDPPLGLTAVGDIALCHASGTLSAGPVERVEAGSPGSADLVSQYSVDALEWARSVLVTGGPKPFRVILAPIGDSWKVAGLST